RLARITTRPLFPMPATAVLSARAVLRPVALCHAETLRVRHPTRRPRIAAHLSRRRAGLRAAGDAERGCLHGCITPVAGRRRVVVCRIAAAGVRSAAAAVTAGAARRSGAAERTAS